MYNISRIQNNNKQYPLCPSNIHKIYHVFGFSVQCTEHNNMLSIQMNNLVISNLIQILAKRK